MEAPERSIYKIPHFPQDSRATRVYSGPVRKWDSRKAPVGPIYGPRNDDVALFEELRARYRGCRCPVPAPLASLEGAGHGEVLDSPWLPDGLEKEQQAAHREWYIKYVTDNASSDKETDWLSERKAAAYLPWNVSPRAALQLFPSTCPPHMIGKIFTPGDCSAYNRSVMFGLGRYNSESLSEGAPVPPLPQPDATNNAPPEHFIFHPGGKVLSLAWAPSSNTSSTSSSVPALLAVAVVPQDDSASANGSSEDVLAGEGTRTNKSERTGSIQFWRLPLYRGKAPPAVEGSDYLPRMYRLSCFDWGWPRRMEWCPVKPHDATMPSLLAVLTEDGIVRVIKVTKNQFSRTTYEKILQPMARLNFPDEPTVQATCMTWVGVNRIVVGYNDGSLALWGIRPQVVVLRLPAHGAAVQDVCSAYPSMPHLVASRPVEGILRLIDLRRPSSEHTFHPSPVASVKGDLLGWSEHMQGFTAAVPFNSPLNNSLDFMHHRHFPLPRRFFASSRESPPTCMAVGTVHPFALVGTADGKVWIANLPDIVFLSHDSIGSAQLVLSSEFRPPPPPVAAASESGLPGQGSTLFGGVTYSTWANSAQHSARSARGRAAASRPVGDNSDDEGEPDAGEGSLGIVIHEGPTAVTSVAWHPNHDLGTWSAIGFASGLVLVKKLGRS